MHCKNAANDVLVSVNNQRCISLSPVKILSEKIMFVLLTMSLWKYTKARF